jgi:ABC-2 type transport system permease protein
MTQRTSPARPPQEAGARSTPAAKVFAVAWREFKHTALTKAFLFGAVILPLVIWGIIAISPLFLSREPPPLTGKIAVLDPSGLVAAEASRQFEALRDRKAASGIGDAVKGIEQASKGDLSGIAQLAEESGAISVEIVAEKDPTTADALRGQVGSGELLAFARIDERLLTTEPGDAKLELLVQTTTSPKHTSLFSRILRDATVRSRVTNTGGDYTQLTAILKSPDINTERVTRGGGTAKERGDARMLVPIAFMMLIWIATFSSGQYLLTTTIEEKSNKVMEVLLSAVSPMQLLVGKILGQALVSALIIVIYGAVAFWGLAALSMADLIQPQLIGYLVLYFIMAYFMIATIMAAVGSAVSDLREAQALVTPAMLILMLPMILWLPISDSPNGMLATVSSFIPPAIPFVMILRLAGTEPIAMWQVILSLVVGFGSMLVMMWAGARIFRIGVLMQGKPPTPLELLRWIRYR